MKISLAILIVMSNQINFHKTKLFKKKDTTSTKETAKENEGTSLDTTKC